MRLRDTSRDVPPMGRPRNFWPLSLRPHSSARRGRGASTSAALPAAASPPRVPAGRARALDGRAVFLQPAHALHVSLSRTHVACCLDGQAPLGGPGAEVPSTALTQRVRSLQLQHSVYAAG